MSNIASTTLTITGPAEDLNRFAGSVVDGTLVFGFAAAAPAPAGLSEGDLDEWHHENWGTDREVFAAQLERTGGALIYRLQVAHQAPVPALATLAAQYPTLTLHTAWTVVEFDACGVIVFEGGVLVHEEDLNLWQVWSETPGMPDAEEDPDAFQAWINTDEANHPQPLSWEAYLIRLADEVKQPA